MRKKYLDCRYKVIVEQPKYVSWSSMAQCDFYVYVAGSKLEAAVNETRRNLGLSPAKNTDKYHVDEESYEKKHRNDLLLIKTLGLDLDKYLNNRGV